LQEALEAQGLLKPPKKKTVWRDKKGRKRVSYRTLPFAGKVGKKTVAAFSGFQVRHGLRKTEGVLDAVSLRLLGLAPMGSEIFLPPVGPQCPIRRTPKPASMCEIPAERKGGLESEIGPIGQRSGRSVLTAIVEIGCERPPPANPDTFRLCAAGQ
jgi:peptidoglycan hydrolase-like protein with peptidoglycan-binding domain